MAGMLMGKLRPYPGFQTISWDYFNSTPNLDIEIQRDQAKTYGVSETRILNLLRKRVRGELPVPYQEGGRPVSGHSGGSGC